MSDGRKNELVADPSPAIADAGEDAWVSLNAATSLLDMHRETVLKLVIKGALVAETRPPNLTFISRESIDRYLASAA